jgi:Conserved TM helix
MRAAVDWESGVSSAWRNVVEFVPKLVAFLIVVLIGWLVARLLQRVTNSVLERVGFDRAVERGGVGAALARSNYDASDVIAKLVYYAVWLIALQLAFGFFGPNPISDLLSQLVAWLPRLVVAIIIIVIASAIAKAVKDLITAALGALSYGRLIATIASVFILGLGVIAALNQVGIATAVTTPVLVAVLATIAGVIVVGVGGGLVRPMQERWERWLANAEAEAPRIREQVQSGPPARQQVSQQYAEHYGQQTGSQFGEQYGQQPPATSYDQQHA